MDSFHLNVEKRVNVDFDFAVMSHPKLKSLLVLSLDALPVVLELSIFCVSFKFSNEREIGDPVITAKCFRVQASEFWVAASNPTSRCDTIRFILEFLRAKFIEVLEETSLQEFRVDFSDTIHRMRTNNTEIGHSDSLGVGLFDDRKRAESLSVVGELFGDLFKEDKVDHVDEFEVSREEVSE